MNQDRILWKKDILLTWDDFQGQPDLTYAHEAISETNLYQITDFKPIKKASKIKLRINSIKIQASFTPKNSWVKLGKETAYLLKHEQGHFDIAEIRARELTKIMSRRFQNRLLSTNYSSLDEAEKEPQKIIENTVKKEIKKIEKTLTISHKSYDKDTNHGKIRQMQEKYNERFSILHQN